MIWATVSSWSCVCWLYRASPSLAAMNIINLIFVFLVMSMCRVISCVVGRVFALTSVFFWQVFLTSVFFGLCFLVISDNKILTWSVTMWLRFLYTLFSCVIVHIMGVCDVMSDHYVNLKKFTVTANKRAHQKQCHSKPLCINIYSYFLQNQIRWYERSCPDCLI